MRYLKKFEALEIDNILDTIEGQLVWIKDSNNINVGLAKYATDHESKSSSYWFHAQDDINSYRDTEKEYLSPDGVYSSIFCIDIKNLDRNKSVKLDTVRENLETIQDYLELNGFESYYEFLIMDRNFIPKLYYSTNIIAYGRVERPSILKTLRIKFRRK